MQKMILFLALTVFLLSGCGKNVDFVNEESFSESKSDTADIPEQDEEVHAEEPEHLQEYLKRLDDEAYMLLISGYKCRYYAEDINGDGYPELFMLQYKDITASIQDLYLRVCSLYIRTEEGKTIYDAVPNCAVWVRKDTTHDPEGGVIEFSCSSDGENILFHSYSVGRPYMVDSANYVTSLTDDLYVYKDLEFLFNGYRRRYDQVEGDYIYRAQDASGKYFYDEEHYERFDVGTYDKTLTFTEDCGWFSFSEAIEHIGEFSE